MSLYRKIFKQSWIVVWKNKYLWFFGLFAFIFGGNEVELVFQILADYGKVMIAKFIVFKETGVFSLQIFANLWNLLLHNTLTFLLILLFWIFILFLIIFIVWLSNISQIAIIKNMLLSVDKYGEKVLSIKKGISQSTNHFWTVFTLNMFHKIVIAILFILLALMSFSSINIYISSALYTIFIILAISFSFVIRYAVCFSVIKNEKVKSSIKSGFALFKNNWLVSLETALFLVVITFFAVIALIMIFYNVKFIFFHLNSLLGVINLGLSFIVFTIIQPIVLFSLLAVISAILIAFQTSVWARLYIELIGKGAESKVVRMIKRK